MTMSTVATTVPHVAAGSAPAGSGDRQRAVLLVLLAGLAVIAALPFSLLSLAQDYALGAALGELALVPACALALAVVAAYRHPWVLHLRAGKADYAVALAMFLPALALLAWGPMAAGNHYYALRPDLLAVPLVATAAVCLVFGVRGLVAFVVPLAVTTLVWPLPMRAAMEPLTAGVAEATSSSVQALLTVLPLATVVPGAGDLRLTVDAPGGAFDVMVASACSGVAGIVGMLLIGLCAQYVLHGTPRARLAWLAAAVALAWALNLLRIVLLLAVGTTFGEHVAMELVHPVAGLLLLNTAMAVHVLHAGRFGLHFALRRPMPYDTPLTAAAPVDQQRRRSEVVRRATALVAGVLAMAALGTVVPGTAAAYAGSLPAVRPFADNPSLGNDFLMSEGQEKKWAQRYFGNDSSWMRYEASPLVAGGGYTVWVDSVFTPDWSGLRAHPIVECYTFHDFEIVRIARPTLTAGLLADEIVYRRPDGATWHVLSWEWAVRTGDDIAHERVTLLASSLRGDVDPVVGNGESSDGGWRSALASKMARGGTDPNPALAAALRANATEIIDGHRISGAGA